ncbi:MAG: response regulator [Acidobacteria bacterium]|nr:response regulator [Acidobacteriota bacterium]
MKILVADDEPTIRELAEELLIAAGYNVLTAKDGEETLRLVYDERPDLLLLDLMLPKMTGFHVLQEIRNAPPIRNTPILILSVLVSGDDTDDSIHELDVAGFIDKAEFVSSLVARVQEILSKQPHLAA